MGLLQGSDCTNLLASGLVPRLLRYVCRAQHSRCQPVLTCARILALLPFKSHAHVSHTHMSRAYIDVHSPFHTHTHTRARASSPPTLSVVAVSPTSAAAAGRARGGGCGVPGPQARAGDSRPSHIRRPPPILTVLPTSRQLALAAQIQSPGSGGRVPGAIASDKTGSAAAPTKPDTADENVSVPCVYVCVCMRVSLRVCSFVHGRDPHHTTYHPRHLTSPTSLLAVVPCLTSPTTLNSLLPSPTARCRQQRSRWSIWSPHEVDIYIHSTPLPSCLRFL